MRKISCSITNRKLPTLSTCAKKVLVYLVAGFLVSPLYVSALCILRYILNSWTSPVSILIITVMIFVFPSIVIALRKPVSDRLDRMLYGWRLPYREMMLRSSERLSGILEISELARELLEPIPRALAASHVSLLLPDDEGFVSKFSNRLVGESRPPAVHFGNDSAIVNWLRQYEMPLSAEMIKSGRTAAFTESDRMVVRNSDVQLLVPICSKQKLVGVLALGRKQRGSYTDDEIEMLARISRGLARTVENAQNYTITVEQAHSDELTGLLSHGFFHRRVDEEISRCSRFGNIFSIVFIDLDLFKCYNDAFGHIAGDRILKEIAACIRMSIRSIDIPCRYGGDEFGVILTGASIDDAYDVGERIRRTVERRMESLGIAITCSIGVASWPASGATKESLILAADSALYWSKHSGRNRVSLASSVMSTLKCDHASEEEIIEAVHALAATVDARDHYTYGHSKKTSEYAVRIAQELGYSADRIAKLRAAALLHDIGKIRVPDNILFKPGPLASDEWVAIREHPKFGVAILKHIKGLSGCVPIIQHHHEHFDGQGYPAGLKGDDIPFDARILAVADAYDAMTSPRPYRPNKLLHEDALRELIRCSGTYFDPEVVRVFSKLWKPLALSELANSYVR
jgi:diguanylate cyclase (GGDEF)-like protein/putative nucleotidyltransferase with HDIG domain